MTLTTGLCATPLEESSAHCACCGNMTRTIWGDLSTEDRAVAVYYVQWTPGSPQHDPNIDLVIGEWGTDAKPEDRVLVSLLYRSRPDGGVMVIDGEGRPADQRSLCGQALKREEVIGTPLAANAFALFDAIWLQDPRIEELRESRDMNGRVAS
jgi:hypothetical protein